MKVLFRLTALAWRYPWRFLVAYLCLLGATVSALLVPRLLGSAIDSALGSGTMTSLILFALAILLLSALRGAFTYGQQYLGESLGQHVAYDLRNALYDSLQHLSFAFHDRQQTGNLMSKATADVEGTRWFVQMGLLRLAQMILLIGGALGLLFYTNSLLGLISMTSAPIIAWRSAMVRIALQRTWFRIQALTGELTTVLQENLTGARLVRAYGAGEFEKGKFNFKSQEITDASVEAQRYQAANSSQITLAFAAVLGATLWVGGVELLAGRLTPGGLAQAIFYLGLITAPVRQLGWTINVISRAIPSGQRIFEVLDAKSPVQEKPGAPGLGRVKGHVRFENVSFSYRSDMPVLQGVSLEALPGRTIALLGAPGSGKTTVVHLVPRFYNVTEGHVTIDGTDVRDVTLESLRRNVGIVMQDVFLFTATLRENIAYGNPNASTEDIVRASRIAQLHDFVMTLEKGYETWVGERGVTLSGGQRQRLAIARSVLLDPPILIFDDSTSSVDAETEAQLRRTLAEVMKGRTTFIIAHRLSSVLAADLVLVMDGGKIVERGTHEELIREGSLYRQIYESQLIPDGEVALEAAFTDGKSPHAVQSIQIGQSSGA